MNARKRLLLAEVRQAESHNRALETKKMWDEYHRLQHDSKQHGKDLEREEDDDDPFQSSHRLSLRQSYDKRSTEKKESSRTRSEGGRRKRFRYEGCRESDDDCRGREREDMESKRSDHNDGHYDRDRESDRETRKKKRKKSRSIEQEVKNNEGSGRRKERRSKSDSKRSRKCFEEVGKWEKVNRNERKRKSKLMKRKFAEGDDSEWRPDLYFTEVKQTVSNLLMNLLIIRHS